MGDFSVRPKNGSGRLRICRDPGYGADRSHDANGEQHLGCGLVAQTLRLAGCRLHSRDAAVDSRDRGFTLLEQVEQSTGWGRHGSSHGDDDDTSNPDELDARQHGSEQLQELGHLPPALEHGSVRLRGASVGKALDLELCPSHVACSYSSEK